MTIKISSEDKQASPNINVTPLIDVLLVLLIIFMVASPLRPSRFKALVPQPPDKKSHVDPNPKTLVVTVGSDAQLKLNGETNLGSIDDANKLSARLAQVFQERRDAHVYKSGIDMQSLSVEDRVEKTVFIKAPRSLHYGEIAKVIDVVKVAGASPVGLQIDDLAQ
jgi:biopolymer transport protein ExbD